MFTLYNGLLSCVYSVLVGVVRYLYCVTVGCPLLILSRVFFRFLSQCVICAEVQYLFCVGPNLCWHILTIIFCTFRENEHREILNRIIPTQGRVKMWTLRFLCIFFFLQRKWRWRNSKRSNTYPGRSKICGVYITISTGDVAEERGVVPRHRAGKARSKLGVRSLMYAWLFWCVVDDDQVEDSDCPELLPLNRSAIILCGRIFHDGFSVNFINILGILQSYGGQKLASRYFSTLTNFRDG